MKKKKSAEKSHVKKADIQGERIKKTRLKKVGVIILWIILIFIFAKGVFGIITGGSAADQRAMVNQYIYQAQEREGITFGAKSFAENFVREYYTFSGNSNSDYARRLDAYLAHGLGISEPTKGISAKVMNVNAAGVTYKSEGKKEQTLDVDVLVSVNYTLKAQEGETEASNTKEVMLRVPLYVKDGQYAVNELPQFVPTMTAADIAKASGHIRTEIDSAEKAEIKIVLESFLKTYCEGNASELSYYTAEVFPYAQGLGGIVGFEKITAMSAYYDTEKSEYLIDVSFSVLDNGQNLEQHMYLSAEKSAGKYYIKSIQTTI